MIINEIQSNCITNVNIEFSKKIKSSSKHIDFNFRNKVIFFIIFMLLISNNIQSRSFNIFKSYEIKIKIKGIGNQNILSDNYYENDCPDIIYLNEQLISINSSCYIINIPSEENDETIINNITLIWNNSISNMNSMFRDCSSLI